MTAPGSSSPLLIRQYEIGPMENFVYFLGDARTREVFVVDPAWQADTILRKAREEDLVIKGALVTHFHFDHTNGIDELLESVDCPVYVNKHDVPYLEAATGSIRPVDDGHRVRAGSVEIELVHTPGHTPGSQCFHVHDNLVAGDTLFINACGRCDLPGGDAEAMYRTITDKLLKFSDRTVLYPGHNYAEKTQDTMGGQKRTNPYLMCGSLDHFLRLRMGG